MPIKICSRNNGRFITRGWLLPYSFFRYTAYFSEYNLVVKKNGASIHDSVTSLRIYTRTYVYVYSCLYKNTFNGLTRLQKIYVPYKLNFFTTFDVTRRHLHGSKLFFRKIFFIAQRYSCFHNYWNFTFQFFASARIFIRNILRRYLLNVALPSIPRGLGTRFTIFAVVAISRTRNYRQIGKSSLYGIFGNSNFVLFLYI